MKGRKKLLLKKQSKLVYSGSTSEQPSTEPDDVERDFDDCNDLDLYSAVLTTPLVEVISVTFNGADDMPCQICGKIEVTDGEGSVFTLFDRAVYDYEKVHCGGTLSLAGPIHSAILPSSTVTVYMCLRDPIRGGVLVETKKLSMEGIDQYDCPKSLVFHGNLGLATLNYIIYKHAVRATVMVSIIKTCQDVSNKGKGVSNEEMDVSNKGYGVSNEEKNVSSKANGVSNEEKDVSNKGYGVSNEEKDVSNKANGVSNEGNGVSNEEKDVSNKGYGVSNEEEDVSSKANGVSNEEKDVSNKGYGVSNEEKDVNNKANGVSNEGNGVSNDKKGVSYKNKGVRKQKKDLSNREKDAGMKGKGVGNRVKDAGKKGKGVGNHEKDVSEKGKDVTNQGICVSNQEMDVSNRAKDISIQEKDVSNNWKYVKSSGTDNFADVYGCITAHASDKREGIESDKIMLFDKKFDDAVRVKFGEYIQLSRCLVVVPVGSSYVVQVDLCNHDSGCQLGQGIAEFPVQHHRGTMGYSIAIPNGYIMVRMEWGHACTDVPLKTQQDRSQQREVDKIPGSAKGLFRTSIEIHSICVHGSNGKNVSSIFGKIVAWNGIENFSKYTIFSKNRDNCEELLPYGKIGSISVPSRDLNCSNNFAMHLMLRDDENKVISFGYLTWDPASLGSDLTKWYNKPLCSVIEGKSGFAAVYYSVFSAAVRASVKVKFYSHMPDSCVTVSGVLVAEFDHYAYLTDYEKLYFKSDLHVKSPEKVLTSSGVELGLSKSVITVPRNKPMSLTVTLKVEAKDDMSISEDLSGSVNFKIDVMDSVSWKIMGDSYHIAVEIKPEE